MPQHDPGVAGDIIAGLGKGRLLTVATVADVLGVSKMTVYRAVNSGQIPAIDLRAREAGMPTRKYGKRT